MTNTTAHPTGVIADHITAVNAFDTDAIMATFADDALVNDAHREFWRADAVRAWVAKEMVGDHVTLDPVEVLDHHGMTIVRARYDGDYPKGGLPDPLIMSNYLVVRANRIVTLFVIRNTPVEGY
jgi:predicted transcriptional regulator